MDKKSEYVRALSKSLNEGNNAAFGVGQKYRDISLRSTTDHDLLKKVYAEIISLYIQSEVSLMKAFVHKKGYPAINQAMVDTLTKDFENIFESVLHYNLELSGTSEEYKLPTGRTSFLNYEDFNIIDQLNRMIDSNDDQIFEDIEKKIHQSAHRSRIRKLFLNED